MSQLVFGFGHRAALESEDFLVADCNRQAVAWVDLWPSWPFPALVLHGPPGCGKSHLVSRFLAQSGGQLLSLVDAAGLSNRQPAPGREPALALDDADLNLAKGGETAMLHAYNMVRESGHSLLLTARTPPARWPLTLADLRSRLNAVPAVGISPPDDALMRALLAKLFRDRQLKVNEPVLDVLLTHMERTFDAARTVVARIDEAALHTKHRIDPGFVRRLLGAGALADDGGDG